MTTRFAIRAATWVLAMSVLGTGTTVFGQPVQLEVPDPNNLSVTIPSPKRPPLPGKKPAKQTAVKPHGASSTMDPSPASMDPLPGQLKTPKKKFQ